jgi:hypothetical protein
VAKPAALPKNNQPVSNRGGARPGAGRKKGIPNKATAPIREAAREYTSSALLTLASVMEGKDQPAAARVAAANALLDRAYGKPSQPIDGDGEGGPIRHTHDLSDEALAAIALGRR